MRSHPGLQRRNIRPVNLKHSSQSHRNFTITYKTLQPVIYGGNTLQTAVNPDTETDNGPVSETQIIRVNYFSPRLGLIHVLESDTMSRYKSADCRPSHAGLDWNSFALPQHSAHPCQPGFSLSEAELWSRLISCQS